MKSSLDGDQQESPPVTRDEAHIANIREAIIVEEKRLKEWQEKTAIIVDLQDKAIQANEAFSLALVGLEKAKKDKAAIEKLTETSRAARSKAEQDLKEAKAVLTERLLDVTRVTDRINLFKAELAQVERDLATAKAQYAEAKEAKEAKLDAIETEIVTAQKKLSTVLGEIEQQLNYCNAVQGTAQEAALLKAVTEKELEATKQEITDLKESAKNIVSDAKAEASQIISDGRKALDVQLADLERIKAEGEAVVIATAQSVAKAKEVEGIANARLASIEDIKQKVLIELGKAMKNAELEKGNKVIQDYLKEIQKV